MHALKTRILTGLLAVLTASLLNACGGAIGDLTASANTINYTGLTTQATLTSDNDDEFGLAMLEGGAEGGDAMDKILSVDSTDGGPQHTAKNQLRAIETLVQEIIARTQQQDQESTGTAASLQAQVTLTGDCGGNIDVSANGSITFNNYCTSIVIDATTTIETTINGTVTYSLTGDPTSGTFEAIYSYSAMTVTVDDGTTSTTHHFSGSITFSQVDNGPLTVTYATSFRRDGKIYKLENPSVTGSTSISMSGKLYHPDYGYVEITTSAPFSKVGSQYCDGTLLIATKNSNGSTISSSTMTVNADCTAYTISFDGGAAETVTW